MASSHSRAAAWVVSAALHALVVLVAAAYFAARPRERADRPGVETRSTDTAFTVEFESAERSVSLPEVKAVVGVKSSPEARIESAIQKMVAPAAGIAAEAGRSPAATALHKPVNYPGKSIVYVVDCSGSMGLERRYERACEAALASLANLSEGMKYQIVLYDSRPRFFDGGSILRPVRHEEMAAVRQRLLSERPEGASRHGEAIRSALKLAPDAIYLLTDADDFTAKEMAELAPLFRKESFNAVLFGDAPTGPDSPLRQLTKERRGGVYLAGKAGLERVN